MPEYNERLTSDEWGAKYNIGILNDVKNAIQSGNVQVWAKELNNIIVGGVKVLEIGCGTGISSLWLAKHGKKVCAIDYAEESVSLLKRTSLELGISVDVRQADATKELPFKDKEFDFVFQSGLLEHFCPDEQIELLKLWSRYTKNMISMIPNAASLPYRMGKQIMENEGSWEYGVETPRHTLTHEFLEAGIKIEKEYTIGSEWALAFLPKRHYYRRAYKKMVRDGFDLDSYMQGYILVTIGRC